VAGNQCSCVRREHIAPEALSQRELDVLRLVARGRSNKGIAHDLTIAENTVKPHVSRILGELALRVGLRPRCTPGVVL